MVAAARSSHLGAMSTLDDQRWDKVLRRQPGEFLYAVTTMGMYCRPGCPSPRPLRKNVRFFPGSQEAEAAGFRACKRCDPKGERAAHRRRRWCATPARFIEAIGDHPVARDAGRRAPATRASTSCACSATTPA